MRDTRNIDIAIGLARCGLKITYIGLTRSACTDAVAEACERFDDLVYDHKLRALMHTKTGGGVRFRWGPQETAGVTASWCSFGKAIEITSKPLDTSEKT